VADHFNLRILPAAQLVRGKPENESIAHPNGTAEYSKYPTESLVFF
jgi:hypothetical protein